MFWSIYSLNQPINQEDVLHRLWKAQKKTSSHHKQSILWVLSTRSSQWSEQDKLFFLSHLNKVICRDFIQAYLEANPEILEGNKSDFVVLRR